MASPGAGPLHRRGAVVTSSVLDAVTELLVEVGYGFAVEDVAHRAQVHKTTVYRKWPTKPRLVAAALDRLAERTIDLDPSDDPVADLVELTRRVGGTLRDPAGGRVIRAVVAAAADDPELLATAERFLTRRYALAVEIIERGQRAGQLRVDLDAVLTWQSIVNPLHLQAILGRPADDATASALVEQVLIGAAQPAATPRSSAATA